MELYIKSLLLCSQVQGLYGFILYGPAHLTHICCVIEQAIKAIYSVLS